VQVFAQTGHTNILPSIGIAQFNIEQAVQQACTIAQDAAQRANPHDQLCDQG
jgi:hypothetical protein